MAHTPDLTIAQNLTCDATIFAMALVDEGLPVIADYSGALPHKFDWFTKKKAFGESQHPWSSPLYTGNSDAEMNCPNAEAAVENKFILLINEAWGNQEIDDTVAIIKKTELHFSKLKQRVN